jgi:antitoxin (DNA-binding transcriptional repressor) of toxin-antitoxin stability system
MMSNANRRLWTKVVNVLARQVPPMREPPFPAVFDAMNQKCSCLAGFGLTDAICDTNLYHIMPATVTVRDLRNRFPKVRKLVELEGEVLLSESGKTKYRLTMHTPPAARKPAPVDYWARLTGYQPVAITAAQARSLHEENRGDR